MHRIVKMPCMQEIMMSAKPWREHAGGFEQVLGRGSCMSENGNVIQELLLRMQ